METKKYNLNRFWTRDTADGHTFCLLSQGTMNEKRYQRFEKLLKKNAVHGLNKREHCLVLGYFNYFKEIGREERLARKW